MENLCKKIATCVDNGKLEIDLYDICVERTKNNPIFCKLMLQKIFTLSNTQDSNEMHIMVLLQFVIPILKVYSSERDVDEEYQNTLKVWFDVIWAFRNGKSLGFKRYAVECLLVLQKAEYRLFYARLMLGFVDQPLFVDNKIITEALVNCDRTDEYFQKIGLWLMGNVQKEHIAGLLLLGMAVKNNKIQKPKHILNTNCWIGTLSLLKTTKDDTTLTVGIWFLVLILPYIVRSLSDSLTDLLMIVKRGLRFLSIDQHSVDSNATSNDSLDGFDDFLSEKLNLLDKCNLDTNSFGKSLRKSTSIGSIEWNSDRKITRFSDAPVYWSRLRQIEIWSGQHIDGSIIKGIRLTFQDLSGRSIQLPMRGEADGTRCVCAFIRGEYVVQVDVSSIPNKVENSIGICGIRITTNFSSYPWLGIPSENTDMDCRLMQHIEDSEEELEEIVGFYGIFDDGLRQLGILTLPSERLVQGSLENVVQSPKHKHLLLYTTHLFRSLYALFPWHSLKSIHDEVNDDRVRQSASKMIAQLKVHPHIFATTAEELSARKWQMANVDDYLSFSHLLASDTDENDALPHVQSNDDPVFNEHLLSEMTNAFDYSLKKRYCRTIRSLRSAAAQVDETSPDWYKSEVHRLRAMTKTLQTTIDQQRHQMQSHEVIQKKWQLELQHKASALFEECKQLREENLHLQDETSWQQSEISRLSRDLNQEASANLSLQQQVSELQTKKELALQFETKCNALESSLDKYHIFHIQEIDRMKQELHQSNHQIFEQTSNPVETNHEIDVDRSTLSHRILRLELQLKQKELAATQASQLLELHHRISDEKLNSVNDKYEHVKATNLALQKRTMTLMKDLENATQSM